MTDKNKAKVGDIVYVCQLFDPYNKIDNRNEIIELPIKSIGSKFITVERYYSRKWQFHVESLLEKSEYTPRYKIFYSKEDYEKYLDRLKREELFNELKHKFSKEVYFNLSKLSDENLELLIEAYKKVLCIP